MYTLRVLCLVLAVVGSRSEAEVPHTSETIFRESVDHSGHGAGHGFVGHAKDFSSGIHHGSVHSTNAIHHDTGINHGSVAHGGQVVHGGSAGHVVHGGPAVHGGHAVHGGSAGQVVHDGYAGHSVYGGSAGHVLHGGSVGHDVHDGYAGHSVHGGSAGQVVYGGSVGHDVHDGYAGHSVHGGSAGQVVYGGSVGNDVHDGYAGHSVHGGSAGHVVLGGPRIHGGSGIHGGSIVHGGPVVRKTTVSHRQGPAFHGVGVHGSSTSVAHGPIIRTKVVPVVQKVPVVVEKVAHVPVPVPGYLPPHAPVQPVVSQYHNQDGYGAYSFGYNAGTSSRDESRDAYGNVRGSFSYLDDYGKLQTQHYTAGHGGFQVTGTNLPVQVRHKRSYAIFPASTQPLHGRVSYGPQKVSSLSRVVEGPVQVNTHHIYREGGYSGGPVHVASGYGYDNSGYGNSGYGNSYGYSAPVAHGYSNGYAAPSHGAFGYAFETTPYSHASYGNPGYGYSAH